MVGTPASVSSVTVLGSRPDSRARCHVDRFTAASINSRSRRSRSPRNCSRDQPMCAIISGSRANRSWQCRAFSSA